MRRRSAWFLLAAWLLPLLLFSAGLLLAAEKAKVRVEAERVVSERREGQARITTFSKARVYHEDAVFTAETIVMRSEGDVHQFTCTGNPVFTNPETRITAEKVIAYSTPRRAEFTGNVRLEHTPKKPETGRGEVREQMSKEPTVVTCDTLIYDYQAKRSEAKGNVKVVQKYRTVWSDNAVYDEKLELITLRGNVRMQNAGEGELRDMKDAETVTVSTANDWIDIVARKGGVVTFEFEVDDDESSPNTGNNTNGAGEDGGHPPGGE